MRLNQFKALSFDCYGTLIDWESGIVAGLAALAARAAVTAEQQLSSFARLEALQEHDTPGLAYSELLATVYCHLADEWGVAATTEDAERFGASIGTWQPFADTVEALHYLKQHYLLVILSNVDRKSFFATSRQLGIIFDAVYTAQDVGSYKPAPENFAYLIEHVERELACPREQLLHVAQSLFHDHVPANHAGLASAFIDRRHARPGGGATPAVDPLPRYDFRFENLAALVAAHRAELC